MSRGRTTGNAASLCVLFNLCQEAARAAVSDTFRTQAALSLSVERIRTNSLLNPSRGNRLTLRGGISAGFLGSDSLTRFVRGSAEFSSYHRAGRRGTVAWRVFLGAVTAIQSDFTPIEERFYAGGPNSVRGFRQNELGPVVYVRERDSVEFVSPTGGNMLVLGNVEYRVPFPGLARRLGLAAFVDIGQVFVFDDDESIELVNQLRVTPGAGLRFFTPIGPIRFDVAYNGYDDPVGALYQVLADNELELVSTAYRLSGGVVRRFRLALSIGEAF